MLAFPTMYGRYMVLNFNKLIFICNHCQHGNTFIEIEDLKNIQNPDNLNSIWSNIHKDSDGMFLTIRNFDPGEIIKNYDCQKLYHAFLQMKHYCIFKLFAIQ